MIMNRKSHNYLCFKFPEFILCFVCNLLKYWVCNGVVHVIRSCISSLAMRWIMIPDFLHFIV
jgi:hypothetical protein